MRTCPECQNNYEDEIIHCPEDGLDLSALEPADELVGRSIGSYQVVKMLGKGGMGAVYLAQHPVIGSRVAIKFLLSQYSTDKKIVDRFFNEAKAVNVIGHDNILKILDLSVTDDGRHYFVMEFLNGRALQDHVRPNEPMTPEVALPILLQICEALQAAHDNQIIHRDLKPDNIYLITHKGKKNFVKVVDFGIAKLSDANAAGGTGKTQTGMVMGTPAYMSPEQAGGMTSMIDGRSDIYSLGVMIYQMLTGKLPFPGSSFGEVLIGHLQLPPPPPREQNPDLPEELEQIILKTLAKKQEERFQSMRELHDALLDYMNAAGISRELPTADAADMAQPTPIKLMPSRPPTNVRPTSGPRTPARTSSPGQRTTAGKPSAMAAEDDRTDNLQPVRMAPPPSSKMGLFIGLGVALLALAGVGGYVVYDSNRRADEERVQFAREAKEKAEQARMASERARQAELEAAAAPTAISVTSDPSAAEVTATWKGGGLTKLTNFTLEVPKMTAVHLVFKKSGYLDWETDAVADQNKTITARLTLDPNKQPVVAAKHVEKRRERRSDKKEGEKVPESIDSTISVDFGDDQLDPDKKK